MHLTTRLAANPADLNFPLPTTTGLVWHSTATTAQLKGSCWRAQVELPPIPAEHIVVPSYACKDAQYQYQWTLEEAAGSGRVALAAVTAPGAEICSSFEPAAEAATSFSAKIDCWHSTANTAALQATLLLYLPQSSGPPTDDLLTITVRPVNSASAAMALPRVQVSTTKPCALSQMQASADIAKRICSPTATAMAVLGASARTHWQDAIEYCLDPNTKAYGKWPLAIYWASQRGRIGSVEALPDWHSVMSVLQAGCPVVCSIRFAEGALPDAPLPKSAGHLVVLYGIEFTGENSTREGYALVMDPAGKDADAVARRYPLQAFSDAWLTYRGGAYLFAPAKKTE